MLTSTAKAEIVVFREIGYEQIAELVCNAVTSQHTRRAYRRALVDFLTWYDLQGRPGLSKAVVQAHVTALRSQGLGASSINQRLSAIRKLAKEAADNGLLDQNLVSGILRVEGMRHEGRRLGNWLSRDQAQQLINSPDISTFKGLRDRALLAVLVGCGLRRSEAARLQYSHIQQREGRWVIVDLVGKRNKTRSVPVPSWAKAAMDAWSSAAGLSSGCIFRWVKKGSSLAGNGVTAQSIYQVVRLYADRLGYNLAAHDLRRTFAKLARKGGADLKQIQLSLGHGSIKTTEIYLGEEQNLTDAPCDRLGLSLSAD